MVFFWLLIGIVVGAYVGITVYLKVNNPRKGEKTITGQVESLFKLRVMLQADSIRNRQVMINNVLPTSVYQLSVRNKENNELLSFSLTEEEAKFIQEKDFGKLTYNGNQFIAFQKG